VVDRGSLRGGLRAFLRDRGIPYVAVDEAKKALFANSRLKSFDFVVYSRNGPNLLWISRAAAAAEKPAVPVSKPGPHSRMSTT